jgi:hypothetical protein
MNEEKVNSQNISWGAAVDGLRLGLFVSEGLAGLALENVGQVALEVLSHVDTQELHLDWYTLQVSDEQGLNRWLRLLGARNRSRVVRVRLETGESLQHLVDPAEWAKRSLNGATPLAPGSYQLRAVYKVANENDCWLGRLEAGPVELTILPARTSSDGRAGEQQK